LLTHNAAACVNPDDETEDKITQVNYLLADFVYVIAASLLNSPDNYFHKWRASHGLIRIITKTKIRTMCNDSGAFWFTYPNFYKAVTLCYLRK